MTKTLPALIYEFIGTFFLCMVIALNANAGSMNLIAIGTLLIAIIYATGHISMAHFNPAVTLAFYLRGRFALKLVLPYILAQCLAALLAALTAKYAFSSSGDGSSLIEQVPPAFLAEALGTFALVFVILNVATAKNLRDNQFYGLAIGFTVIGCGLIFGPYSGAAFNPAVALSQSIGGFFAWSDFWLYLLASVVGGIVATVVFKISNPDD